MGIIDRLHGSRIHRRRVNVLSAHVDSLLPEGVLVLDVGCGDGWLARRVLDRRPDLTIHGMDVLVRSQTHVPVAPFDGKRFPFPDKSFDIVMFIDVLHHTEAPMALLREAVRVARSGLLIKDHTLNGLAAAGTLTFMDRVGNARHGVALPHNYWTEQKWRQAFADLGLTTREWRPRLGLYAWPLGLLFDRSLHFVTRLDTA
jgi:ubiquinone/menaquinone biosynthesis C-methylase UbiE